MLSILIIIINAGPKVLCVMKKMPDVTAELPRRKANAVVGDEEADEECLNFIFGSDLDRWSLISGKWDAVYVGYATAGH